MGISVLMFMIMLNLIPTEQDQNLLFMAGVNGWEPRAGDIKQMDYLGLKYEKSEKPVENILAIK